MKRKSICIILVGCMMVSSFTGCSEDKKEVNYNLDSTTENASEETKNPNITTLGRFSDLDPWKESFAVEHKGQEVTVRIDGDVEAPEVDYMSVMEVKIPDVSEETFAFVEDMAYPVEKEIITEKDLIHSGAVELTYPYKVLDINIYPKDIKEAIPDKLIKDDNIYYGAGFLDETDKNLCKYSIEEAKKLAQEFLKITGYTGYQVEEIYGVNWWGEPVDAQRDAHLYDQPLVDGYAVEFGFMPEEECVKAFFNAEDYYDDFFSLSSGAMYATDSQITLYIMDEGVIRMELKNPVQVVSKTKVASFLSFESVQNILRSSFQENFEEVYIRSDKFSSAQDELLLNSIELTYFRIRDKQRENYYSYIPVWRFCRRMKSNGENIDELIYSPVLINAIDGSIINLREEF